MDIQHAAQAYTTDPEYAQKVDHKMQELLARSATDSAFRQRLLTEPRAALKEFTGRDIPESVNIVFVENKATATFVLPEPVDPAAELSESELETVAGGATPCVFGIIASILWIASELA